MAKSSKEELKTTVAVSGFFTLVLLIIDLTYKNIGDMFNGPDRWTGILWVVLHSLITVLWFVVVTYWQDPNKNLFRVVLVILNIAAIALTMGHRSGWLEQVM